MKFVCGQAEKNVTNFKSTTLGHGLINRIEMALKPQRDARKRPLDGLVAPSKAFDAADRSGFIVRRI